MREDDEGWIPPLNAPSPAVPGPTLMGGVDGDAEFLYAFYDVDTAILEREVPEPLEIAPESEAPRVRTAVGDGYQPPHTQQFHEGLVSLKVQYDGRTGWYSAYIWTHNDEAMDGGRIYGINKQICDDTPLRKEGDQITGVMERYGEPLFRLQFAYTSPPPSRREESVTEDLVDTMGGDDVGVFGVKKVPSPEEDGKVLKQVVYNRLDEVDVAEIWAGNAALEFHPQAKYPYLHKLEPESQPDDLHSAYYLRPQWLLSHGEVVWERFE